MADYQKWLAKTYKFSIGDLVLRKVVENTKNPANGKLSPNWKGPEKIVNLDGTGTYYLKDPKEKQAQRP